MKIHRTLFILAILGIFFLLAFSKFTEPKLINLNENNFQNENGKITLQGKIEKINFYPSSSLIFLENSKLEIIVFTNYLELKKGDQIEIQGRKEVYKNKTQLIADRINCLNC